MKPSEVKVGDVFGKWEVLGDFSRDNHGKLCAVCRCECGVTKLKEITRLVTKRVYSCGCYDKPKDYTPSNVYSYTRLYGIWNHIKQRCKNKKSQAYNNYGRRGVFVCDEWNESFENFRHWSLKNGYEDNLTIDRKEVDGPYSPENCRWTTNKVQQNNRTNNVRITVWNEEKTMSQWSEDERCVVGYRTLQTRINCLNWEPKKAITTPAVQQNKKKDI